MSTDLLGIAEETLQVYKEESQNNLEIGERFQANNRAIQHIRAQLQEQVKRDIEGESGTKLRPTQ